MPSETDIANRALRKVGGQRITSFTDGTPNANIVEDVYTEIRDELLEYPWNFATKRVKMAQSSTAPAFEFDFAYPLPADWIYTISVHDNDAGVGTILYREEWVNGQKSIVTSSDPVYLRYVFRVTDPNLMSAGFRTALTSALARELAIPIADDNTLHAKLEARAKLDLAVARSVDAKQGFPEMRPRGSWANSRGGWYGTEDCHT